MSALLPLPRGRRIGLRDALLLSPVDEGNERLYASGVNEEDVALLMTPAQRVYASAVRRGMSQVLGVAIDYIWLVETRGADGSRRVVAIDARPNGQELGNHDEIMARRRANPSWWMLDIDGQLVDLLAGCTVPVYEAMIAQALRRGQSLLPDSLMLSQENDQLWTSTLLLGERLTDDGCVLVASVQNLSVSVFGFQTDRGGQAFRVRAAVEVADLNVKREGQLNGGY